MARIISGEIKERLEQLKKAIEKYRYDYHVLDKETISPAALDSLKYELVKIEQQYPELVTADSPTQRVGGKPLAQFEKISHKVAQWSFNDAFSEEDIVEFDARVKRFLGATKVKPFSKSKVEPLSKSPRFDSIQGSTFLQTQGRTLAEPFLSPTYVCELKIDGLKVVLEYEKGLFVRAATRGDGKVGEDVTSNVKTIESVPLKLTKNIDIIVEGEVWMPKSRLVLLNKEQKKLGLPGFANPRNVAAGSIRQLDPKIAASRKLETFIYDIAAVNVEFPQNQADELRFLQELGFKVNANFRLCSEIGKTIDYWKEWQKKSTKEDYLVDGVVINVN